MLPSLTYTEIGFEIPAVISIIRPGRGSGANFIKCMTPDGDMVDPQTTLEGQFLDLAIGEREGQVPADREQDHFRLILTPRPLPARAGSP